MGLIEYPSIFSEYTSDEIKTPHCLASGAHNLDGARNQCAMWGRKGYRYTIWIVVRKWNTRGTEYCDYPKVWARGIHDADGITWKQYAI